MADDAELIRGYAERRSEEAFAELVRRHLGLVYSAALRRLGGDAHGAADVAQQVFVKLARDAGKLSQHTVLAAWLYTATRNAAVDAIRADVRRQRREQEAHTMQTILASSPADAVWEKLRPVLDATLDELDESDRMAVLLRFFEKRGFAEIGAALRISEDAARMRVERALEKLRGRLERRGIRSATAALAAALANQATVAAPAGLAAAITGAVWSGALAGGTAATAGFFMNTSTGILGAVAVAAAGAAVYQTNQNQRVGDELAELRRERDGLHGQLAAARQSVEKAAQQAGALQRELDVARAPKPVARPVAGAAGATGTLSLGGTNAGDFYLQATPSDPAEARRQARTREAENVNASYAALYRQLGWSAEQRQQFCDLMFECKESTGLLLKAAVKAAREKNPQLDRAGTFEIFEATLAQGKLDEQAEVRRALGEAAGQALERYQAALPMRHVAGNLATGLFYSDAPLAPAQAEQLIEVLTNNARGSDGRVELGALNVDAAMVQAQGILNTAQIAELRRVVTRLQEQARVDRARNTGPIAPTGGVKPAGG